MGGWNLTMPRGGRRQRRGSWWSPKFCCRWPPSLGAEGLSNVSGRRPDYDALNVTYARPPALGAERTSILSCRRSLGARRSSKMPCRRPIMRDDLEAIKPPLPFGGVCGAQRSGLPPNAELSAAPLAGVEGELAVGWRPLQQTARRRRRLMERTSGTHRGDRSLRRKTHPGYDRASGVGCTAWLGCSESLDIPDGDR
jgi:hypothetical protein